MKVYAVKSLVFDGYVIKGLYLNELDAVMAMEKMVLEVPEKYGMHPVSLNHFASTWGGGPEFEIEEMEVV
jgi:coproporphyrinogen III oxidase-like Fe-S oxidoreductase